MIGTMSLVFLAIFFFLSIGCAILVYPKFTVDIFKEGRPLKLRGWLSALFLTLIAIGCALLTLSLVRTSTPNALDRLFVIVFSAGWAANVLYLLPRSFASSRIPISVVFGVAVFFVIWTWPVAGLVNVFYAGSILWIGPVVFRRFKLPLRYFIIGLILFLLYDVLNILALDSGRAVMEETGRFSGLVAFDGNELGIGDFFIAYAMANAAQYYFRSVRLAWVLAILFALPLLLLKVVPVFAGMIIPYTIFLIPVAFVGYGLTSRKKVRQ